MGCKELFTRRERTVRCQAVTIIVSYAVAVVPTMVSIAIDKIIFFIVPFLFDVILYLSFSIVLFRLNQEKAVATFKCYLDSAQLLLNQLTCTLHHPTGSLGDNLVLGRGSEGKGCAH